MKDEEILKQAERLATEQDAKAPFSWRQIFGDDQWEELSKGNSTGLGDRLSKLVAAGLAPTIEHAGIARSGRMNLFRRKKGPGTIG